MKLKHYPQLWSMPKSFDEALTLFEYMRDLAISANHNSLSRLLDLEQDLRDQEAKLQMLLERLELFISRLTSLEKRLAFLPGGLQ